MPAAGRHDSPDRRRAIPAVVAGLSLAWLATAGVLALGLLPRAGALALAAVGLFSAYFAIGVARWARAGRDPWAAVPWLAFLGPCGAVAGALLERHGGRPHLFLIEVALILFATLLGHAALLFIARAADATRRRWLARGLAAWLVATWVVSTAAQIARFRLLQRLGHPEDTGFLWDTFRSWAAGGPLLSGWAAAWGHEGLRSYFGLHFSPIVLPAFAVTRLLPDVGTLLAIQGLFVMGGLWAWGRVLAAQARHGRADGGTPAALWLFALLAACPPLNAALRNELHPLLWSLPALAWLHAAYLRRARGAFALAAASLFLFREDLGLVLVMYAPLAWLEGRRGRGEVFWFAAPLLGLPATAALMLLVMPRWGSPDPTFFHSVYATTADGVVPLLLSLAASPGEALARLLRPGHLVLALRLALTGAGAPWRSWLWLPGLPLAAMFGLVAREMQLLRIDSHYFALPALYAAAAALLSWWGPLHGLAPRRRETVLVLLWTLAAAQPARLLIPDAGALRHPARYRAEVLADLALLGRADRCWIPVQLMTAADPARAVPAHRIALERLDPARAGAPGWALLPAVRPEATEMYRLLARHYALEPAQVGTRYGLYRLVR